MKKSAFRQNSNLVGWLAFTLCVAVPLAYGQSTQQVAPGSSQLDAAPVDVREYSVELIVFEYADGAAGTTEVFLPDALETPYFGDAAGMERETGSDDAYPADDTVTAGNDGLRPPPPEPQVLEEIATLGRSGFERLPAGERRLTQIYQRLSTLDAYRPLLHVAWRQPPVDEKFSVPINLRRLGNAPLRLDGTVNLYLSRFLHLVVDLSLEDKSAQRMPGEIDRLRNSNGYGDDRFGFEAGSVARSVFYHIKEDRIVKNGELRYFDHPKFGVIARIDRVEKTDPNLRDDTNVLLPPND